MTTELVPATIPAEQIERVDAIALQCRTQLLDTKDQFAAAIRLAELTTALEEAVSEEMVQKVMALAGKALGFKTDKDDSPNKYPIETVRGAFIEATVRGFRPVNNEFNIIAGRFYGCRTGFERLVKTFPGLANFEESMGVPEVQGGNALVPYLASWILDDEQMQYQRGVKTLQGGGKHDDRIVVRINQGMGMDAIQGKAYRKAYGGIYNLLTGHVLPTPEGEVGDDAINVDSKPAPRQSGLFSDEPAEPEEPEGVQPAKVEEYRALIEQASTKKAVSIMAKTAGADTTLSIETRKVIMDLCTQRGKEI